MLLIYLENAESKYGGQVLQQCNMSVPVSNQRAQVLQCGNTSTPISN